jgi:arginase
VAPAGSRRGGHRTMNRVALLGVPLDHNSSFLRGPAEGPAAIRAALHSGAANLAAESGVDFGSAGLLSDAGDVAITEGADCFEAIRTAAATQLAAGGRLLALGGDHSITSALVAAHEAVFPQLSILHFDAHPDLYDEFEGNRSSHASPFARIMERGRVRQLVQVGIRTLNAHQQAQAKRFGVLMHGMNDFDARAVVLPRGPVYLSFDLDALDPAFAPGVSHHEPGGLSVRDVLNVLRRVEGPIVGADIVELNPRRDLNGMTSMVAAKLVKEIGGRMSADP